MGALIPRLQSTAFGGMDVVAGPTDIWKAFDEVFADFDQAFRPLTGFSHRLNRYESSMLQETDTEYRVDVPVPGCAAGDVEVWVDANRLLVKTKPTNITRAVMFSRQMDIEQITATVKHGLLTITVPKMPSARRKAVTVVDG